MTSSNITILRKGMSFASQPAPERCCHSMMVARAEADVCLVAGGARNTHTG